MGAKGGSLVSAAWDDVNKLSYAVSDITTGAGSIEIYNGGFRVGSARFQADKQGKAYGGVFVEVGCSKQLGAIVFDGQLGSPSQFPLPTCPSSWGETPGLITDIAAVRLPDGSLQLFAVRTDHGLRTCWKVPNEPGAAWTLWQEVPAPPGKRITSGNLADGRPQLWAISNDSRLYTKWKVSTQPGAAWTEWSEMPGALTGVLDITAVRLADGGLQLFAIGTDHDIRTCWKVSNQPGAAWTSWQGFPGPATPSASGRCTRITSGNLSDGGPQLWAIGQDLKLYTKWKVSNQPGADWTDWS